MNLNVSGTKRDVAPKQRYDKFPSVGDHINAIHTFEYAWVPVADWDSMGHVITQTRGRAFQKLSQTFSFALSPQKLDRASQKDGNMFQKLS